MPSTPLQRRLGALLASLFLGSVWALVNYIPLVEAHHSTGWIALVVSWYCGDAGHNGFALQQPAELSHLLTDAAPKAFICRATGFSTMQQLGRETGVAHILSLDEFEEEPLEALASGYAEAFDTVRRHGDDTAALLYSSGTTGRPKGAIISHRVMTYCATTLGSEWRF